MSKKTPAPLTASAVQTKFRRRIRNVVNAAESSQDPYECLTSMERKVTTALDDFPFMLGCPKCGGDAFWVRTKKHPAGFHACFDLDCDWTSTNEGTK